MILKFPLRQLLRRQRPYSLGYLLLVCLLLITVLPKKINPPVIDFANKEIFYQSIAKAKDEKRYLPSKVYGGVVPHDIFSGSIVAGFFRAIAEQLPTTLIILGPNHQEVGNFYSLSSQSDWQTPLGMVQSSEQTINSLVSHQLAKIDNQTAAKEHSITVLLPFIKYYLPQAKVVPLILSKRMTLSEVETLADRLAALVNEKTIVIASVDFSHYLTREVALAKDDQTISAIKNYDYRTIANFNSDYLDSPAAISTLLMVMQKLGKTKIMELDHSNSGEIAKSDPSRTTSYYSLLFY